MFRSISIRSAQGFAILRPWVQWWLLVSLVSPLLGKSTSVCQRGLLPIPHVIWISVTDYTGYRLNSESYLPGSILQNDSCSDKPSIIGHRGTQSTKWNNDAWTSAPTEKRDFGLRQSTDLFANSPNPSPAPSTSPTALNRDCRCTGKTSVARDTGLPSEASCTSKDDLQSSKSSTDSTVSLV